MNSRTTSRYILALILLAVGGCSDTTSPPIVGHFEVVQGPPDRAAPGLFLLDTMRVRLVDNQGRPLADRLVTWVVRQGGGSVIPIENQTDASGIAESRWSLGSSAGLNEIEVRTLEDTSVTFQTTGEAFRVDRLDSSHGLGCGLVQGDVWCWGYDSWVRSDPVSEQPSDPFTQDFNAPGLALGGQNLTQLVVGWPGGCGLNAAGTVHCFGPSTTPFAALPAVPPLRRLAANQGYRFCGVAIGDSTAWCWSFFTGVGAQVTGSPAFLDIETAIGSSGTNLFSCGRLVDSTAACWGDGPPGNGSFTPSDTAVAVSGALHFAGLSVGTDFACGYLANGELWCWGQNDQGQLGGPGAPSAVPVLVTNGVTRLATEFRTGMAIRNGTVIRWGSSELGGPVATLLSLAGVQVVDFSASDISCVHLADRQVYCFDELWFQSSSFDVDRYSPVQPVTAP
ncbi:MAG: hypothetical protein ABI836_07475 [Gemmatimonadota bacterium]